MSSYVLVALGASVPGEALVDGVAQLRAAGAAVHLVSRRAPTSSLVGVLSSHRPIGRPGGGPVRLSKLVVDPHRLPGAFALLARPRLRRLVRAADVLVAVDAEALPAVWLAARANRRALAVRGLPAALARRG